MRINWMNGNKRDWLWLDIRLGAWWYVFIWRKGHTPFLYRSKDATPPGCPSNKNSATMIFGHYVS